MQKQLFSSAKAASVVFFSFSYLDFKCMAIEILRTRPNRWFRINQVRFIVKIEFFFYYFDDAAVAVLVFAFFSSSVHKWRWTWIEKKWNKTGFLPISLISNRRHNSIYVIRVAVVVIISFLFSICFISISLTLAFFLFRLWPSLLLVYLSHQLCRTIGIVSN